MLCLQPAWLLRTSSVKKKKFEHLGDAQGLAGKNTKTKSQIGPWLKSTAKHNIHTRVRCFADAYNERITINGATENHTEQQKLHALSEQY